MDVIVAIATAFITFVILGCIKVEKTSSQLMMLGLEISIVGAVIMVIAVTGSGLVAYLIGLALIVSGIIVNLFGFSKKR